MYGMISKYAFPFCCQSMLHQLLFARLFYYNTGVFGKSRSRISGVYRKKDFFTENCRGIPFLFMPRQFLLSLLIFPALPLS